MFISAITELLAAHLESLTNYSISTMLSGLFFGAIQAYLFKKITRVARIAAWFFFLGVISYFMLTVYIKPIAEQKQLLIDKARFVYTKNTFTPSNQ